MIKQNYGKSTFFDDYSEDFFNVLRKKHEFLLYLSIDLIILIRDLLNLKTEAKYSSDFSTEWLKDELLVGLSEYVGAIEYISPPESKVYLNDSDSFIKRKIPVKYFDYNHVSYPQLHGGFIQYMSVIDLLFNYDTQSKTI
jgi:hypothetical protein